MKAAYSGIYDGSKVKEATSESIQTLKRKKSSIRTEPYYMQSLVMEKKEERYRALKEKILSAQKGFLKQEYRKSIQEFMNIVDQTILKENSIHNIEEVIRRLCYCFGILQRTRAAGQILILCFIASKAVITCWSMIPPMNSR